MSKLAQVQLVAAVRTRSLFVTLWAFGVHFSALLIIDNRFDVNILLDLLVMPSGWLPSLYGIVAAFTFMAALVLLKRMPSSLQKGGVARVFEWSLVAVLAGAAAANAAWASSITMLATQNWDALMATTPAVYVLLRGGQALLVLGTLAIAVSGSVLTYSFWRTPS